MLDTASNMVVQYNRFERAERGLDGLHLADNVDAIAILLDHVRNAAHLPLDPGEPFSG